jgi:hypothetical protein
MTTQVTITHGGPPNKRVKVRPQDWDANLQQWVDRPGEVSVEPGASYVANIWDGHRLVAEEER